MLDDISLPMDDPEAQQSPALYAFTPGKKHLGSVSQQQKPLLLSSTSNIFSGTFRPTQFSLVTINLPGGYIS